MKRFWQILNQAAALASVIAVAGLFSDSWRPVAAMAVVVLVLTVAVTTFVLQSSQRAIHGKASLTKKGVEIISTARRTIVMFASDMSWIHDYSEALKRAKRRGVSIEVVYDKSDAPEVEINKNILAALGAQIFQIPNDCGFRGTLVDDKDANSALLFVARKGRSRVGKSARSVWGTAGEQFEYSCQVFNGVDHPDVIKMGAALFAALADTAAND